ncbi:MAG: biopolymer transporter ExbD [Flavobacteriaceae bacterium]|nr:biopolymer transporter ExbD [Flavobacteriaceae bacterium]
MRNQKSPEINASSMADIAFLLLIFFLVTATLQVDLGILKRLPSNEITGSIDVNQRNLLEVTINSNNELLLEGSRKIDLADLKKSLIDFIDNGTHCDYCNGKKNTGSSDHPTEAVVQLQSSRNTSYGLYVSVQNEINSAYIELRNKLTLSLYGMTFSELESSYKRNKTNADLSKKVEYIREKYPMLISENTLEKKS